MLGRVQQRRLRDLARRLDGLRRLETERGALEIAVVYDEMWLTLQQYISNAMNAADLDAMSRELTRLNRTIKLELTKAKPRIQAIIEDLIEQAAARGTETPLAMAIASVLPAASIPTVIKITRELAKNHPQKVEQMIGISFGKPVDAVAKQIERKVYKDGLNLSQRLHRRTLLQAKNFDAAITQGIKNGQAAVKLAKRLESIGGIDAQVPKYLREVVAAARTGNQIGFQRAWQEAWDIANTRKAGPLGVRDVTRQFLDRMQTATGEQIQTYVDDYLHRKATYHATVVARHETNEASRAARKAAAANKPWIIGLKWNLSGSHPADDICDDYASHDSGLGKGVYKVADYPETPHPNCMCFDTEVIDPNYWDEEEIRTLVSES